MLAYDLYLRNKDSKANVARTKAKPVKKIYVNRQAITIDPKKLEQYGSEICDRYRILQESLNMPLNTSDRSQLNLPDCRTSTRQPNPYINIFGTLMKTDSDLMIELNIKTKSDDKENILEAKYDVLENKTTIKAEKDIPLRIDTRNYYFIDKENGVRREANTFEQYVKAGVLTNEGSFSKDLFKKVANEFFKFTKESLLEIERKCTLDFLIFLLPSDSKIEYHGEKGGKNVRKESTSLIHSETQPHATLLGVQ